MNKFKTIFGVFLGATMLLGVGVAVSTINKNQEVKEAQAATDSRFSILIDDDSWWKNAYAQIWATYSAAGEVRITPDPDLGTVENDGFTWQDMGDAGWYAVLTMEVDKSTFTYDNFYFQRKNPADGGDWGNSGWVLSPSMVKNGTCNTVRIDSSNKFQQDWGNYWKMTTYAGLLDYTSTTGATKAAYLKSSGYAFVPENPSAPVGYEFEGWYKENTFTNKWTSSSRMTADTTLYAKYVKKTAFFVDTSGTLGDELTYNTANGQFEGIISVEANQKFAVRLTNASGTVDYHALDSTLPSTVAVVDGNYVKIINEGAYIVYFKSDNTMWIQTAEPYLVAYAYAGYFLTNVGCDATGAKLPSGWGTVKNRYETAVTDEAKDYIYNFDPSSAEEGDDIAEMLARYQIAIKQHQSLDNFLKDSDGNLRYASFRAFSVTDSIESNNALTIITIIAAIGVLTTGAYMFFKKGKKVEQ